MRRGKGRSWRWWGWKRVTWKMAVACLGLWSFVDAQVSINYENACCGRSIMQSLGLVAIETDRVLATGNYTALRGKFCSSDPTWIQLWRPSQGAGMAKMVLQWQLQIFPSLPSSPASTQSTQIVTFVESPLSVNEFDRLGLLTSLPTADQTPFYPVPYDTDARYTLYFSQNPTNRLNVGDHVVMDDLRWPRSFRNYMVFCPNASTCPSLPTDQDFDSNSSPSTTTTTTTTTLPDSCCAGDCAKQDQLQLLKDKIDNQTKVIGDLEKTITDLVWLIRNFTSGGVPAVTCPSGFVGAPGVPNCYLVYRQVAQMAGAILTCVDDHEASLVSIRSDAEENFLRSLVSGYAGTSEYWTAGMFKFPTSTWVWYDESLRTQSGFVYKKWYNGVVPVPANEDDVCMTLTFDPTLGQDYWNKKPCFMMAYFICQLPRTFT